MATPIAHINRIGTAVPSHDVHGTFVEFVGRSFTDPRQRRLFDRMVAKAGIDHRFSFLEPVTLPDGQITDAERFYAPGRWPDTATRMARYETLAPQLAMRALHTLGIDDQRDRISHLVVSSCTGFVAPGIDQLIVKMAGLNPDVERTVVGFMGCYAAVNSLRLAHHVIRSEPASRVLVVNLELCTLHFQQSSNVEHLLSMLLFGDGCAAALVTADPTGLALRDFRAATIEDSGDAITWRIGQSGFDMHLSGAVPTRIARALAAELRRNDDGGLLRGTSPDDYTLWAVHAGGRSILDAVTAAFRLAPDALSGSRGVLKDFGNMSSATLMFVLERLLHSPEKTAFPGARGFAVAFGPGLAAESFRFSIAA